MAMNSTWLGVFEGGLLAFGWKSEEYIYKSSVILRPLIGLLETEKYIWETVYKHANVVVVGGVVAVSLGFYGSLLEQPLDDLVVATTRSRLQRVAIASSLCINVSPLLEQPLDDLVMAVDRSCLQRVAKVSSLRVNVSPLFEQLLDDLVITIDRSCLQRIAKV